MNRRLPFVVSIVLATGCAETEVVPEQSHLGVAPVIHLADGMLVPTRQSQAFALEGARQDMQKAGFEYDVSQLVSGESPDSLVAMTNRPGDPQLCGGTAEVVAVAAVEKWSGIMLRLSCQTQHLMPPANPGDPCLHTDRLGCPVAGDRLVAEIALNAVSTL